jgi:hypothetical protein
MSSKTRGATSWGQRSYNKDNRDGGWSSKGKFGGSKGSFGSGWQNRMDPAAKLKFSETIKIDPEVKALITDMNFSPQTLKILEEKKFTQMTPVQTASYDPVFNGKDVVARSRTGTGKTFAFGLPIRPHYHYADYFELFSKGLITNQTALSKYKMPQMRDGLDYKTWYEASRTDWWRRRVLDIAVILLTSSKVLPHPNLRQLVKEAIKKDKDNSVIT